MLISDGLLGLGGSIVTMVLGWPGWLVNICLRVDYIIKSVWCVWRLLSGRWIRRVDQEEAQPAG